MRQTETLIDGRYFVEGPRWRDGRLYFSDFYDHCVMAVDEAGKTERVLEIDDQPSGLGWLPDGNMLVVAMHRKALLEFAGTRLVREVDMSALAGGICNDMVVSARGDAYIGNFGSDLVGGAERKNANLILVRRGGEAERAAPDMMFPNGSVITPDGGTLIIGETFGARLTAFDIRADGGLENRRVWADLTGHGNGDYEPTPDGICLDAEGLIWVTSPSTGEVLRVAEGGALAEKIAPSQKPYCCMLGGADRCTLYIGTCVSSHPDRCVEARMGKIETVRVDVAGAGLP